MLVMNFATSVSRSLSGSRYLLLFERQVHSKLPAFNYGLSGKGKSKKSKTREGLVFQGEVLFGIHPIILTLQAQRRKKFYELFMDRNLKIKDSVASIYELCEKLQVDVTTVPRESLDILSGNRPHQGVCLDTEPLRIPLWDENTEFPLIDKNKPPIWLMVYNVQDPMNFGAILRSAFFLGVDKILIPARNSCRLSPVVSKASAGAMELVDLVCVPYSMSLASVCQWWKSNGGKVMGTGSSRVNQTICQPLHKCKITIPTLIILGNEGTGISDDLIQECDQMLTIPQTSPNFDIGSLNVSVAAGIILHWLKYSSGVD